MPGDSLSGLFKHRLEIDLPGGETEENARLLAFRGLLRLEERQYVHCVNPLDHDRQRVRDMSCPGRIYLDPDLDEENGDYRCPDCGRCVYPSRKHSNTSIRLFPLEHGMRSFVRDAIGDAYDAVEEWPSGVYRIRVTGREVCVCLVDVCAEPRVFAKDNPYGDTLLYIIGNARDYRRRLPKNIPVFLLAELVLNNVMSSFHHALRRLVNRAAPTPLSPASFDAPGPPPGRPGMQAAMTTGSRPDHGRIPVAPGTRWNQIQFFYVNGEILAIKVPGQPMQRYLYEELGMANKRNREPTRKWEILVALCEKRGVLPWTGTIKAFGAFKEQVSCLRKTLQAIFGINSDPFLRCNQEDGLGAAFQAFPELPTTCPGNESV